MTNLFKKVQSQLEAKLPFAVYSKPGSDVATGIFQKDSTAHFLYDFSQKGFVFAPFNGSDYIFIPAQEADIITEKITDYAITADNAAAANIDAAAKQAFENLVQKGIDRINNGEFKKVVLSRIDDVQLGDTDIVLLFQKLVMAYPMAFKYCFYHPKTGLWAGATPEQLLKADGNVINTVALAGTQVYKEDEIAVWENKEKEEQQFVTDFISNSLQDYVTDIKINSPYTFRAGNLVHIKTDIVARLSEGRSLKDVVQALHPTPAVCGLPKTEAKEFILSNEGYDREYYSGFLGELNADFSTGQSEKTDLFVNLRCMKIEGSKAKLIIGCGITKDSDPEKEFMETVNKAMTMKKVL